MEKITILIVDDHKLVRDTWTFMLNKDPRLRVIAATPDAEEANEIALLRKPDIILMDLNMSPVSGLELTQQILTHSPNSKIIAVSMHSTASHTRMMLGAGAMGYVTKYSSKEELINGIIEVYHGRKYISLDLKQSIVEQVIRNENTPGIDTLSKQELQVIQLIKEGLSSKEISKKLKVSVKTIEAHRYNILKKLNLRNRAALVNFMNTQGV